MASKITIEGSFTEKPRLLIDGVEVPYDRLRMMYLPKEEIKYNDMAGQPQTETLPEEISLEFSLQSQVGQLQSNTNYRVKANKDNQFIVEQVAPIERDIAAKKKKKKAPMDHMASDVCPDCGSDMVDSECPDCGYTMGRLIGHSFDPYPADPNSIIGRKNVRTELARNLINIKNVK